MKRYATWSQLSVFVLGFILALLWQSWRSNIWFRPVQFLHSSNNKYQAVLERGEFFDLNFRVKLNGNVIYKSPDFAPNRTIPFREQLLWDDNGNLLILEIGGRRLFGYDVVQARQLSDVELLQAKVSLVPVNEYGFEGQWPAPSQ